MIYLQKENKGPTCILVNQKKKKEREKQKNNSPKCFFTGGCVFSALTPTLNKLNLFIFKVESHIFVHVKLF